MKVEIEQGNIDNALVLHLYREKVLSAKEKYQLARNYLAKKWFYFGGIEGVNKIINNLCSAYFIDEF